MLENLRKQLWTGMEAVLGLVITLSFSFLISDGAATPSDAATLLDIKSNFVDSWGNLANWQEAASASVCSWTGVTCNASEAVVGLDLASLNLTGTISADIQRLSSLTVLNVSHNGFSGRLSEAIANLSLLVRLDVGTNCFSGSFPNGFSHLQALKVFSASNNNFTGPLPLDFALLPALEYLDLSGSYFEGSIPVAYGNIATLHLLRLSSNLLTGSLPKELGNLSQLRVLEAGYNAYAGGIPKELGNLQKLEYLDLAGSNLSGSIPKELGQLPFCNTTFLFKNRLTGGLPPELGHMSSLMSLDVSENNLGGSIPEAFSNLHNLTLFSLMFNGFSGSLPAFIGQLPRLQTLKIFNNLFWGPLPPHLGQSASLQWLDASSNRFQGPIPPTICQGGGLVKLELFLNHLSGPVPDLRSCLNLVRLRLQDNQLTGSIPLGLGALKNLTRLELARNKIGGSIPADLGMASSLAFIDLSGNLLGGSLPGGLWRLPNLQVFNATGNTISGSIPDEIGNASSLLKLYLSNNLLTGVIPETISDCKRLVNLDLSSNKLIGALPIVLADLLSLATLDISHNSFTGSIPFAFAKLTNLEAFNVSYNNLSGAVPLQGIFKTATPGWFDGNVDLCGGPLPACSKQGNTENGSTQEGKKSSRLLAWIVGGIFAVTLGILIVGTRCFYVKYGELIRSTLKRDDPECPWKITAFQRLGFTAYELLECIKESNIIGKGAAGTVFKAEMSNGEVVAVKKLRKSPKELRHEDRGFLAEVHILGGIRHRNIVRLLGCCSNGDNNLLIYEYMPNGSLGQLLHGKDSTTCLTEWITRYNIAVGVAQGLCYLHHDCSPLIVHRDVKSNNILLDCKMEARVADFGVAKLVDSKESMSMVAGSYGYIAPEYAYTMKVDEKSDIYSFGVVLLELLTGKRPVEPEFGDAVNIVEWVRSKGQTQEGAIEVLDANIGAACSSVQEEMMLVLRVALLCTSRFPRDRPSMRDVVTMLSEAKPRRKGIMEKLSPSSKFVK
ncbi:hypothetical protein O6H91_07G134200 [Diphasiastrum complanatum]|uniref:Uncharacterized protein n=1 Tax=Diphasiastrum complanatum TaxID=34168 RepID=A0ACC2DA57_DIPCM|nr:hypothetical protein O6H91_07G134200 [Diphasiastrum complanatum]